MHVLGILLGILFYGQFSLAERRPNASLLGLATPPNDPQRVQHSLLGVKRRGYFLFVVLSPFSVLFAHKATATGMVITGRPLMSVPQPPGWTAEL